MKLVHAIFVVFMVIIMQVALVLPASAAWGFNWGKHSENQSGNTAPYSPTSTYMYSGYWDPDKRWLYASPWPLCYDESARSWIAGWFFGTQGGIWAGLKFDDQIQNTTPNGNNFHTALHVTGWWY